MSSDKSERVRHPGYRALVSPTCDWQTHAPDAFHWTAYGPRDAEGMADRHEGFEPTREAADAAIADALSER